MFLGSAMKKRSPVFIIVALMIISVYIYFTKLSDPSNSDVSGIKVSSKQAHYKDPSLCPPYNDTTNNTKRKSLVSYVLQIPNTTK